MKAITVRKSTARGRFHAKKLHKKMTTTEIIVGGCHCLCESSGRCSNSHFRVRFRRYGFQNLRKAINFMFNLTVMIPTNAIHSYTSSSPTRTIHTTHIPIRRTHLKLVDHKTQQVYHFHLCLFVSSQLVL